jgi:hypothetical protein
VHNMMHSNASVNFACCEHGFTTYRAYPYVEHLKNEHGRHKRPLPCIEDHDYRQKFKYLHELRDHVNRLKYRTRKRQRTHNQMD